MPEINRTNLSSEQGIKTQQNKQESSESDHLQMNYIVPCFEESSSSDKTDGGGSLNITGKKPVKKKIYLKYIWTHLNVQSW